MSPASHTVRPPIKGIANALAAAVLFGLSTPLAKGLVGLVSPILLAGLLYLGSGLGLSVLVLARGNRGETPLVRKDLRWLGGAVLFGGILGPTFLMLGLAVTPASTASLLLNTEVVFTAVLAWCVFRESFSRRIGIGLIMIVSGSIALSWSPSGGFKVPMGAFAVVGACLCWGIDNNLTQKVSAGNPYQIAAIKGAVAGTVNLIIAAACGARLPSLPSITGALLVGFLGYGLSLVLFVMALRRIGTARTGAYFALAPFAGALVSVVLLGDKVGPSFVLASVLMGIGAWLHLTEWHGHEHTHGEIAPHQSHEHDGLHDHGHSDDVEGNGPHAHPEPHRELTHTHPHYPDVDHRHEH